MWKESGINLLRCHTEEELERADRWRVNAWVPVPVILGDEQSGSELMKRIASLKDHPSLVVWEAQDEAIWNACRLETGKVTTRPWSEPPEVASKLRQRLDGVVRGLARGSKLIRSADPKRKIWLNEACRSDQDTLARCIPYLDIVGFDYYPVPPQPHNGRDIPLLGDYTERFHRTAPTRDLWVVEQAFSWSTIRPEANRDVAYPNADEYRFMAWQAITHGATGLLWWGSHYEDRPAPFLKDLMTVVAELKGLELFLFSGEIDRVTVTPDPRQHPAVRGVRLLVRRWEDRTLLALINEDPHRHDVTVSGLDWVGADQMEPMRDEWMGLEARSSGLFTQIEGKTVRLFTGS